MDKELELNNYISKKEEKELINIQLADLTEINLHKTIYKHENNNKSNSNSNDNNNNNETNSISNKSKVQNILNTKIKIIDYSNSESINMIDDEEEYQIRAFRSTRKHNG